MGKPNLFIIGMPKCGTTSLYHYLDSHPNVFMSKEKEPHYFNTSSLYRFYKDESLYLKLFNNTTGASLYSGEASVWYFYFKEAIDNILSFNDQAKFIFLFRNPVDLFFSLHQEMVYIGEETETDPEKAWNLINDRKNGTLIPFSNSEPRFLYYDDICNINFHIQYLKSKIDPNRLLICDLENLKKDPDGFIKKTFQFLNLEYVDIRFKMHNKSNNKSRKNIFIHRISRYLFKLKRRLNIRFSLGLLNLIEKLNKSQKNYSFEYSKDFKQKLENYFHEKNYEYKDV